MVVNYMLSGTAKRNMGITSADANQQSDPWDFSLGSQTYGQIIVAANESYGEVTLTLHDDSVFEGDQTVAFHLLPGDGYTIGYFSNYIHLIKYDDIFYWVNVLYCDCGCKCPVRSDVAPDGGAKTKAVLGHEIANISMLSRDTTKPVFSMRNSFEPEAALADSIEVFVEMGGESTDSLWFDPADLSSDDAYLFSILFDTSILDPGLYDFAITSSSMMDQVPTRVSSTAIRSSSSGQSVGRWEPNGPLMD